MILSGWHCKCTYVSRSSFRRVVQMPRGVPRVLRARGPFQPEVFPEQPRAVLQEGRGDAAQRRLTMGPNFSPTWTFFTGFTLKTSTISSLQLGYRRTKSSGRTGCSNVDCEKRSYRYIKRWIWNKVKQKMKIHPFMITNLHE